MCQCFGIARLFFRQTHLKADAQYNRKRGAHTDGVEGKKRKFLVVRVLLRPACSERQKFGPRPGVHASLQVQKLKLPLFVVAAPYVQKSLRQRSIVIFDRTA